MAGTYTQIYIHLIFAVKGRECVLYKEAREEVFKYIVGIIKNKNQKSIIVNGMSDHVHVFVGLRPSLAIADLVRDIKNNSTKFINENKLVHGMFAWQEGYGAFSYGHSQIDTVYNYILNQEEHHAKRCFKEEYIEFLKRFDISYNNDYLFEWYSD